jgi:uncharacterized protein (TIGR03067 family)
MTRFAMLGGVILALSFSASAEDKKDVPKELALFQGTWKVVKAEFNGKEVDSPKLQFTFRGEKADYVQNEKETGTGAITVDATKTPGVIDLTSEKGEKSLGIYKFESDGSKLVIGFVKGGDKRPTKFDSSELPDMVVLTLEKVKK